MKHLAPLVGIAGIAWFYVSDWRLPSSPPENPTEADAWVMAKELVRQNLKSPSSADFGSPLKDYQDPSKACASIEPRAWHCKGWVDSQNGFGAMMRTEFEVVVATSDGARWELREFVTK